MKSFSQIIILGGGVIGLSIAAALGREGAAVTVLDAGSPGQASWAAAGMLAPLAELSRPGPFVSAAVESLHQWPAFAARLREETGQGLSLFGPGTLRIARTEDEGAALRAAQAWQSSFGLPLHLLDAAQVGALEPALSREISSALLSLSEQSVEPRVLLTALTASCRQHRVQIFERRTATGFVTTGEHITAVQTAEGAVSGDIFVVAGGAWSEVLGRNLGVHFPISPLRGQMISLGPCSPAPIRHIVYTHGSYLVPRPDGTVIAGATEEPAGFDAETTTAGLDTLRRNACGLVPTLSEVPLGSAWAGLRPVSADGLPMIGTVPGWENLHIAAGHGRNGILLTPLTGGWLAGHLLRGEPIPTAFSPERFCEVC